MQRLSPRFRSNQFFLCQICRETVSPNFLAHPDGLYNVAAGPPIETSVTEFCYKSLNLSLEEPKMFKLMSIFLLLAYPRAFTDVPQQRFPPQKAGAVLALR